MSAAWDVIDGDGQFAHQAEAPMLLWTDPPYGTGRRRTTQGHSYYDAADTRYVISAIASWLPHMHPDGVVVVCCDYRLAPHLTVAVLEHGWVYRGEIVWEFGLGRPRSSWWPVRHNNLLTFTRTGTSGQFDQTAIPRAKRLAPKAGYPEDKPSGSVWDFTMSNTHPGRMGYPNEKPVEVVEPFILAHTSEGDLVLDPFCGSSATGAAAIKHGRRYVGIDINPQATAKSRLRLGRAANG